MSGLQDSKLASRPPSRPRSSMSGLQDSKLASRPPSRPRSSMSGLQDSKLASRPPSRPRSSTKNQSHQRNPRGIKTMGRSSLTPTTPNTSGQTVALSETPTDLSDVFSPPTLEASGWPETPAVGAFADPDSYLSAAQDNKFFSAGMLAAGIQRGASVDACREYLDYFGPSHVYHQINLLFGLSSKHWHVLHYAIQRNDPKLVRLILQNDADPNISNTSDKLPPLLAWAIMVSKYTVQNTTEIVKVLLEYGANPGAIPIDMWSNYLQEPTAVVKEKPNSPPIAASKWCKPAYRAILAETMNLSQRYALFRAHSFKQPTDRAKQISEAFGIQGIFRVPFTIIGQAPASRMVAEQIPAEHAFQMNTPLVMAFAGPSGHGKTELAKQMGDLLNVDSIIVDCAQMRTEWQLFGATQGYSGSGMGSPLNNFLAKNAGKSCVVFLDEFDKTVHEVRQSLLTITESGSYIDRTSNKAVDAKKAIWILATNLGDATIERYHKEELEGKTEIQRTGMATEAFEPLQAELKGLFKQSWKPPFVGRIRLVVPFFPFSRAEQTVVAHKFLLQLVDAVRQPINTHAAVKRYIGHTHLHLSGDVELARYIAERYYDTDLGARSFAAGLDAVKSKLYKAYTRPEGLLEEELNKGKLFKYSVGVRTRKGEKCVVVEEDGLTEYTKMENETAELGASLSAMSLMEEDEEF